MDRLLQFQNLIECNSLIKKIHGHRSVIEEENKRVTFVTQKRLEKNDRLEQLTISHSDSRQQYSTIESELQAIYRNFEKSKENLSMATSQKQVESIEKEIENLGSKIESLEEDSFSLMEKIEEEESELAELKEFLTGSELSLAELQKEVGDIVDANNLSIQSLEEQITKLLEACEKEFHQAFIDTRKKFETTTPITFINGRSCRECALEIDESARDNVDRSYMIEYCSGCDRLIVPLSATNYSK